jgi:hypothetical protein
MARVIDLEQATFTPLEAYILAGVSQVTQRDWRRREMLGPKKKGWTKFTTVEIAALLILNRLIGQVKGPVAWMFSKVGPRGVVNILARRAYGPHCRIDRTKVDASERFSIYAGYLEKGSRTFLLDDLSKLPDAAREGDRAGKPTLYVQDKRDQWRSVHLKQSIVSHYVVLDLCDMADELEARQIKPYFVEKKAEGS